MNWIENKLEFIIEKSAALEPEVQEVEASVIEKTNELNSSKKE